MCFELLRIVLYAIKYYKAWIFEGIVEGLVF